MSALPSATTLYELSSSTDLGIFAMTGREGAIVFVRNEEGKIRASRINIVNGTSYRDVERAILKAALPEAERAHEIRIVTSADLACADVHAQKLPNGIPLAAASRVTYGLDVGRSVSESSRPARALIVADTRDDLPLSRDESHLIASSFSRSVEVIQVIGSRGYPGSRSNLGNNIPNIDVHAALATSSFFHYAGHASEENTEPIVPLANNSNLTISDIIALQVSPERVVLSACQAGRFQLHGLAIGIGFVQSFLERGAREVIAPTRPVRDDLALALAQALVSAGADGPGDFATAITRLAEAPPYENADWAAYRVWRH